MSDAIRSGTEIAELLDAKIPRDAVSLRSGGGSKQLSYLETWYVIDRMNKVFGHLNWSCETAELRLLSTEKPSYLARVRIMITLSDGRVVMKDGVGYGSDKSGMNPHEMAAKEAESDAFKRAAKNFGLSLGLALYAKDDDLISDGDEAPAAVAGGQKNSEPDRVEGVRGEPKEEAPRGPTRDQLMKAINEMSRTAATRRLKTRDELVLYMEQTFGVKTKEQLDTEEAAKFVAFLDRILKEG